jgi:hypothetical protein
MPLSTFITAQAVSSLLRSDQRSGFLTDYHHSIDGM